MGPAPQGDQEVQDGRRKLSARAPSTPDPTHPSGYHLISSCGLRPWLSEKAISKEPLRFPEFCPPCFSCLGSQMSPSPSTPVSGKRLHFPWQRCSLPNSFRPGQSQQAPKSLSQAVSSGICLHSLPEKGRGPPHAVCVQNAHAPRLRW